MDCLVLIKFYIRNTFDQIMYDLFKVKYIKKDLLNQSILATLYYIRNLQDKIIIWLIWLDRIIRFLLVQEFIQIFKDF